MVLTMDESADEDEGDLREFLQVAEAAEYIGVSPQTLRRWDRSGRLVAVRRPENGYRYYRRSDLEPFLVDQISKVVHQKLPPETLQRFREGLQLDDSLARQQPALFIDKLAASSVSMEWLSPEYVAARDGLTPD